MDPAKLLYIDKKGVSLTRHTLKVKNNSYLLKDISSHELCVINGERLSGVLLLMIGSALVGRGILDTISINTVSEIEIGGGEVSINLIELLLGIIFTLAGTVLFFLYCERYALRIHTKEGKHNAVVSNKKVYITKIVDSMNCTFEERGF